LGSVIIICVYSNNNGDPFEFHSQDNEDEILSRTRTPPPPPPPQLSTNTESRETEPKEQYKQNSVQNDIVDVYEGDKIVTEDEEAVSSLPMHVADKSSSGIVNANSTRSNANSTRSNNVIPSVPNQMLNQSNTVNTDSNRSEVCNEITPSEHGQVVDRSSEDPLNSDDVRSEMASSEVSSPRYAKLM